MEEEWNPQEGSFVLHMLSGSIAGVAEHVLVFPLDTLKTFSQAERGAASGSSSSSSASGGVTNSNPRGLFRLLRGVSTMLTGCVPAHAAYFALFEWGKATFGADGEDGGHYPLAAAASGAVAVMAHDLIMTPLDVVKQRMQLGMYRGIADAFRSIARAEGVAALFLSYPTTLIMNIPFAAISVASNESFKKILNPTGEYNLPAYLLSGALAGGIAGAFTNPLDVIKTRLQTQHVLSQMTKTHAEASQKTQYGLLNSFARVRSPGIFGSGQFSHSVGSNVMMPTLFSGVGLSRFTYKVANRCTGSSFNGTTTWCQLQSKECNNQSCLAEMNERHGKLVAAMKGKHKFSTSVPSSAASHAASSSNKYRGLVDTALRIYKEEGAQAFFRGARARVMVQAPGVAISWSAYETAKSVLGELGV